MNRILTLFTALVTLLAACTPSIPQPAPSSVYSSAPGGNARFESSLVRNPIGTEGQERGLDSLEPLTSELSGDGLHAQAVSSGAEMVRRAQRWVDLGIAYNQRSWFEGYRQDCSGLISMAWGLDSSAVTGTLKNYAFQVAKDQLEPGDIVNNQGVGNDGHVVMFGGWVDAGAGRFVALEQNGGRGKAVQTTLTLVGLGGGWTLKEYQPYAPGPYVFQRSSARAVSATPLVLPVPQSPAGSVDAAKSLSFSWSAAQGVSGLGVYISKYPYGAANLVFAREDLNPSTSELILSPSSFRVVGENRYRWNMVAYGRDGSERYTSALNFTLEDRPTPPSARAALLVNAFDGQCLDVAGGSRDEGARVLAWPCHGAANQRYALELVGGEVQIVAQHSGSCLSLPEGAAVGAKLVQRRCSGAAGQRFALERFGDAFRLRNPASGLCLDEFVPAGKVSGDVGGWSCHSGSNQLWRERP